MLQTVQINPIMVNNRSGMDIYDIEAERQAKAIRLQNSFRPIRKFFKKNPTATPINLIVKN